MQFAAATEIGLHRETNEDSYCVYTGQSWHLFAVADGMGGHAAGDVASRMALEILRSRLEGILEEGVEANDGLSMVLLQAIKEANRKLYQAALRDRGLRGMGTTLTAVVARGPGPMHIGHVGDSRAYVIRDGSIRQISRDHSPVGELMAAGEITEREAMNHPQRHYISRALGTHPVIEVDVSAIEVRAGDNILLCTDGLSSLVFDDTMKEVVTNTGDLDQALDSLIDLAMEEGGDDNITSILIEV